MVRNHPYHVQTYETATGLIRYVEDAKDFQQFSSWVQENRGPLAVDSETTGLNQYAEDFKVRLLQVAHSSMAWVIPAPWAGVAATVLLYESGEVPLTMHNASFDIQAMYPTNREIQKLLWRRTTDTRIPAHLADPRGREEGGTGHGLAELVKAYLPESHKEGDELKEEFLRLRKEDVEVPKGSPLGDRFKLMPLDNEVFIRYAGQDAMLTARLAERLPLPKPSLQVFEHKVARIMSGVDSRGFLLDVSYTEKLAAELKVREEGFKEAAAAENLENINSVAQIAFWMEAHGIKVPTTPKGNPSINGTFLKYLRTSHPKYEVREMANMIIEGKKAGKWRTTWVEKFLDQRDWDDRVHPSTNTLRARTARFSVTGIPAQTLPASDSTIRACFVAEPGERIVAVDYSNQELRYLAAVSGDQRMIQAFANGEDLHLITAEAAFPGRGLEMRKYGKLTNFATVYGVRAPGLADQTGLTVPQCQVLLKAFRQSYPGVADFANALVMEANYHGYITTMSGRVLPVDPGRSYAALNYYVQGGCRDITAQGIVNLDEAGYADRIRLAIHDELILSWGIWTPEDEREIRKAMEVTINGVHLPVEVRIGGRSWGSLYGGSA